jgi:hypothetical protein
MLRRMRWLWLVMTFLGALGVESCGVGVSISGPLCLPRIELSPNGIVLKVGETQLVTVTVHDGACNITSDPAENYAWSTDAPAVATVDLHGMVRAVALGEAFITARGSPTGVAVSATIPVHVRP